jgi:hypothetical protein
MGIDTPSYFSIRPATKDNPFCPERGLDDRAAEGEGAQQCRGRGHHVIHAGCSTSSAFSSRRASPPHLAHLALAPLQKGNNVKTKLNAHRGAQTHDHKVKSLALCRALTIQKLILLV